MTPSSPASTNNQQATVLLDIVPPSPSSPSGDYPAVLPSLLTATVVALLVSWVLYLRSPRQRALRQIKRLQYQLQSAPSSTDKVGTLDTLNNLSAILQSSLALSPLTTSITPPGVGPGQWQSFVHHLNEARFREGTVTLEATRQLLQQATAIIRAWKP
ncbi:MAG: hypothetical protein ACWA5X_08405 [bacterium]